MRTKEDDRSKSLEGFDMYFRDEVKMMPSKVLFLNHSGRDDDQLPLHFFWIGQVQADFIDRTGVYSC